VTGIKYYSVIRILPDFKDPDVWKGLEKKCFDGSINYENYPAREYKYFDRLRILYLEYQAQLIGKNDAAREKTRLYREYIRECALAEAGVRTYRIYNKNRLRFGSLRASINKARSAEEKLGYALELIGMLTDDELFVKINMPAKRSDSPRTAFESVGE